MDQDKGVSPEGSDHAGSSEAVSEFSPRSVMIAALSGAASGTSIGQAQYCFGYLAEQFDQEYAGYSRTQINVALSVGLVVFALVSPFAGRLLDVRGPRQVVPVACLIAGIGWGTFAAANSVWIMYAAYALIYVGFSAQTSAQTGKVIGRWFPKNRGRVMGFASAGNNLGGVIFVQLATALGSAKDWRWSVTCFACIHILVGVLYAVFLRDTPSTVEAHQQAHTEHQPQQQANRKSMEDVELVVVTGPATEKSMKNGGDDTKPQRSSVWRLPHFPLLSASLCLCFWTYSSVLSNLQPALEAGGMGEQAAATCISLAGFCGIGSKIVGGTLAEKLGAKRTMQVSLAIQCVAIGLLSLHSYTGDSSAGWAGWTGSVVYGCGFGAVGALIPLIVLEQYGVERLGEVLGLTSLTFVLPGLAGPLIAGAFFDETGLYAGAFLFTAAIFLVAGLLLQCLLVSERRQRVRSHEKKNYASDNDSEAPTKQEVGGPTCQGRLAKNITLEHHEHHDDSSVSEHGSQAVDGSSEAVTLFHV